MSARVLGVAILLLAALINAQQDAAEYLAKLDAKGTHQLPRDQCTALLVGRKVRAQLILRF